MPIIINTKPDEYLNQIQKLESENALLKEKNNIPKNPLFDRYVKNSAIQGLLRPQEHNECSINSIGSAFNALFPEVILFPKEIYKITGWSNSFVTKGKVGNDEVIEAIKLLGNKYDKRIEADIWIERKILRSEQLWEKLKEEIQNDKSILILHMANHYNIFGGYFEEPWDTKSYAKKDYSSRKDQIILAEPSSHWDDNPIRSISFKKLVDGINENDDDAKYCIIKVIKH